MKTKFTIRGLLIFLLILNYLPGFTAWINFEPQTIIQPDGNIIHCYGSGDEFYNWLHDEDGFTILQNHEDGYYYYAILESDYLIPFCRE